MVKDNKEKFSFNFIDFLIITVLIVCVCIFIYSAAFKNDAMELVSKKTDVLYTVKTEGIYSCSIGENVFITKNDGVAGQIVAISQGDNTMTISINASAYTVGGDIFVKGQELTQGAVFELTLADGSTVSATCIKAIQG